MIRPLDVPALTARLAALRTGPEADAVARRSYRHPNGFAKLLLAATGDPAAPDRALRLHVWPAGDDRPGEAKPHTHRWVVRSTVLTGALRDVHHRERADGAPHDRYRYGGANAPGSLVPTGPRALVVSAERTRAAGDRYALTTDVVHAVRPLGTALVATLVVQDALVTPAAVVYAPAGSSPTEVGDALATADVRALVDAVLAALNREPHRTGAADR